MGEPVALLAKKDNFGSVYQCENGCFHLQIGRANLALSLDEYVEMVSLVNASAANFELMREAGGPNHTGR